MSKRPVDQGRHILDSVTAWAQKHDVPVVSGYGAERLHLIRLTMDHATDVADDLCGILGRISPYLIVTSAVELSSADLEARIAQLTAAGADAGRLAAAGACRTFIGHLASCSLRIFITGGPAILAYTYVAPWMDDAYPDEEEDTPPPQDPETLAAEQRARAERAFWTPAHRTEAARRIANDPRFPQAKKEADRIMLTRDVLGPNAPDDDDLVTRIRREAKSRYEFEVAKRG
ncbi:MAG: hypothetical protein ACYC5V_02090 [Gemmatimonadaceae bacterium]